HNQQDDRDDQHDDPPGFLRKAETVPRHFDQSSGSIDNRGNEQPAAIEAKSQRQEPAPAFPDVKQFSADHGQYYDKSEDEKRRQLDQDEGKQNNPRDV